MIPTFENFNIKEETSVTDNLRKQQDMHDKLSKLKDDLHKAQKSGDKTKERICQIKLEIFELDEKKFKLQKELERMKK